LKAGLDHYNFSVPASKWSEYSQYLSQALDVPAKYLPIFSTRDECVVSIISRVSNRRILNEVELSKFIKSDNDTKHCQVQIVPFESYDISTQLRFIRNTTILFGIDGSGLLNAALMRRCTSIIRIMPWGVCDPKIANLGTKGGNFQRIAEVVCGNWQSYCVNNRKHTKFPKSPSKLHKLLSSTPIGQEENLNISNAFSIKERLLFFFTQDTYIDPTAAVSLIKNSIIKNKECHDVNNHHQF
jgi:hypothetical protein